MNETGNSCLFLLQNSWHEALWTSGEKVWVSLKHFGCDRSTDHGEIRGRKMDEEASEGFKTSAFFDVKQSDKHSITLRSSKFGVTTKFMAPVKRFTKLHNKSITALDISSGGGLGVSASTDETLLLWDTATGTVRRTFTGHAGEVNCCKFFPSGVVVLSGGMDTQLKIWSTEDGSCARTLSGSHNASISCTEVVDRGRNIISCSNDGTARLWECGSATCISCITKHNSKINASSLTTVSSALCVPSTGDTMTTHQNDLEFETKDKVLITGSENGDLLGYDVANRTEVLSFKCRDSVNCCTFLNETTFAVGLQDGTILLMDILKPGQPLLSFKTLASAVLCLSQSRHSSHSLAFWASFADGRSSLFYVVIRNGDLSEKAESSQTYKLELQLQLELSGPDCDPVNCIVQSSDGFIYTASRDAVVRKYKVF
ncbi:unnamed protein product [Clavelina lepadiformis]|uniref:Proteasomal ATPase-associated factor 1 n=1 Tax=Clavelina lepadiformis TaxID=159417 RepID=A0ABP0G1H8_CLALP